jgi:hypothetical protein
MISKKWRIKIFNWFGAGRIALTNETEYNPMSTYSITAGAGAGSLHVHSGGLGAGHGGFSYNTNTDLSHMNITASSINFNVAKAAGGWIVQVNKANRNSITLAGVGPESDLHIIHESEDFDSALGKIVTMSCLKA